MISRRRFLAAAGATALAAPLGVARRSAFAAPATCALVLENKLGSGTANAYVTGHEQASGRWMLLTAGGSPYYPESPAQPQTPLPVDCAIPVGAGGSVTLTLPQMYGARIYFVRDDKLDFFVNPGPALVEPAFATATDANYAKTWSFAEFTFNPQQLFANISFVDLITALPIGLTLEGDATHTVRAASVGAVGDVASALAAQAKQDGQPWDKLVIRNGDTVLRAISPQNLMAGSSDAPFGSYWNSYVDQVWAKYAGTDLKIDLQGGRGVRTGRVSGDTLTFETGETFAKPASKDIFTCNDGPFANNPADSDDKKALLARLAAAFNRSTVLNYPDQPDGAPPSAYYSDLTTNHWARIVHANTPIGYAFPYDDVRADGQPDVSGAANDGNPGRLTVTIG